MKQMGVLIKRGTLKSSEEKLKSRGMVSKRELEAYGRLTDAELYEMFGSTQAAIRSAAIHILAERHMDEADYTERILRQLSVEKSLYTRMSICNVLEHGNKETAIRMTTYLGKIGNNQYRQLPDNVSRKKSYPLQRDIIARTLAKMNLAVFPVLIDLLKATEWSMRSEGIDAVGYMVFYNRQLATEENAQLIYETMYRYKGDSVIYWKLIQCLSAFSLESCTYRLQEIMAENPGTLFEMEAARSLHIQQSRK